MSNHSTGTTGDAARDAGAAEASPIDRDELLERVGGDLTLLRQVIELFEGECPRLIAEMQTAAARGDFDAMRRAAHSFKGAASNFARCGAAPAARRVEQSAAERHGPEAASAIAVLEVEAERLLSALRDFDPAATPTWSWPGR